MRECRVCGIGRRCEEFASVNGYIRNVCRECHNRQRRQRTSEAMSNDDASETVSIGPSTFNHHPPLLLPSIVGGARPAGVEPEPPGVFDMHDEQEGRLRLIEGQLRALTDEHRKWSMPSIGQRLVQLEHEMQSLRGGNGCECSTRDPLWVVFVWLACTTVVFVVLRWVEGRLRPKSTEPTNVHNVASTSRLN